jgi:hypothetical protein
MVWSRRKEYIQIEAGDLDLYGWEYKAMIDVVYLYLTAVVFGIFTGAFILIINKKITNRQKKRSKEIEKIPRGGDGPSKEELYKFFSELYESKVRENGITHVSCFEKPGFSKIMNKKTARKIYDSLKKKSFPVVVTVGTAILAHKAANVNSLSLKMPFFSWPIHISVLLGSNLSLIAINYLRIFTWTIDVVILVNCMYTFYTLGVGFREFIAIYQVKEKALALIIAILLNLLTLKVQKMYCNDFVTPVSMELVSLKPDTTLLPDSSNGIYVQFLSSSSSLKLVLKETPQCKVPIEDVLSKYGTLESEVFNSYLKNQYEICAKNRIFEGEVLSLKDFNINTFKGDISSEHWEIIKKESYNEEKKLNQMLLDSAGAVEVVNDFPKPTKIVPQRDLNCEKKAYEKTFEGKVETILGDLEGPSEMPTPIQTQCSRTQNFKKKNTPLKKRTKTLADLPAETDLTAETSTVPENFGIKNKNQ